MKTCNVTAATLLAGLLFNGCSPKAPSAKSSASGPVAAALPGLPAEFTVKQRSTTGVPGSGESLRVTIDDITRGQTMVSLAGKDETLLLAPRSMQQGAAAEFKMGGQTLTLILTELSNALIGEDFATFTLSQGSEKVPDEAAKIALLLGHIKALKGAAFIRNGSDYPPGKAAEHLATKLSAAGGKDLTAREFIDNIASKSSLSDEAYTIRMADGTLVSVGDYLRKELDKIERPPAQDKK